MVHYASFTCRFGAFFFVVLHFWPGWSQIQPYPGMQQSHDLREMRGRDPRVWSDSTVDLGARSRAKHSGKDTKADDNMQAKFTWIRKRAFRRACRRATQNGRGGTMYRGHWMTTEALLGQRLSTVSDPAPRASVTSNRPLNLRQVPRLRVRTYNLGGVNTAVYDTLCAWLRTQPELDILFLQEIHFGFGREEATWVIPGWLFIVAPDSSSRYSGVGMVISTRIASPQTVSFCTWAPGRILQARCQGSRVNLDLFSVYQWVRKDSSDEVQSGKRSDLWHQLSRALGNVPRRNLLVVGGDLNSSVVSSPGLIGRGLLKDHEKRSDPELISMIEEHQLNGSVATQIDFVAVRKGAADRIAKQACTANIPFVAGWMLKRSALRVGECSRSLQERIACADRAASRHDLREVFSIIQQIAPKRTFAMTAMQEDPDLMQALAARQQLEEVWQGQDAKRLQKEEERPENSLPAKFHRGQTKGQNTSGKGSWDAWNQGHWGDGDKTSTPDYGTQALIRSMTKLVLRQEEELGRLRIDTSWMFFLDNQPDGLVPVLQRTAEQWQQQYEAQKVDTSLRVILFLAMIKEVASRLGGFLDQEAHMTRAVNVGWASPGATALSPMWHYQQWNPETRQVEAGSPNTITRFKAARRLEGDHAAAVVPFMLSLSLRSESAALCHAALVALDNNASMKYAALRLRPERGARSALAKEVEENYLQLSYTDWQRRSRQWQKLTLPESIYYDAQEGWLLWDGLCQALQMHGRTMPPALSVSGRNDLLAFARQELPEEAYMQLVTYADELSRSLPSTRDIGFPPQIADVEHSRHPAEELAWALLDEGRGSLWHAIRAIATLLPFDRCARRSASSPHMAFAAGAYGHHGYVGMHHHTQLMPRVCRLFNRFILSICPDHRWTSFQVLCDSLLDVHIDSQNARLDSFMIGISYFSEGAVWVQDSQGLDFEDVRGAVVTTMVRWVDDPAERSGQGAVNLSFVDLATDTAALFVQPV
ncbi:unnamed protein product [Symbiodinium necroappetens]|uniref:Endonuclease/exonuclease/phosphatase domain-containing protein n=1 Tax=Symbiodinium necroappetens TaxID=1628268 RepID=A0A812MAG0_9DINO|nr:unnamed protein product [Symbiodinium necroappetens]